jgi:hypothetical protein
MFIHYNRIVAGGARSTPLRNHHSPDFHGFLLHVFIGNPFRAAADGQCA